jgi:vitamin-K-epoxide reductase (warfarin-sensitive)
LKHYTGIVIWHKLPVVIVFFKRRRKRMLVLTMALIAALGFFVSLYTYFVELKVAQNASYKAACDLTDRISCTKPITSPYGKLFGISNALLGIGYYALFFILTFFHATTALYVLALMAFLFSLYLAWLLYFRIRAFCILCTSTYVINILLLILSYIAMRQ